MVIKSFKYRIKPNKRIESHLIQTLEFCRFIYNKTLELRKNNWEQNHITLSYFKTLPYIIQWKKEFTTLNNVHSQVLQNVQERVDLAFKAFFKRVKIGQNPGYPRFKSVGRYDSFTYPQSGFNIHPTESTVYLSKIGRVPIILHRPVQGKIKTCTVSRSSTGKWFVSLSCEIDKSDPLPKTGKIIGIDLGLKIFIHGSDGFKIPRQRFFKKEEKELTRAQRKFSKFSKTDKSPEKERARKIVTRIHERIRNKRQDFCHKTALKLVQSYDMIFHENLNIKNMLEQKKWSQSIADASWAQLIEFLSYKAAEAGKMVTAVDPRNTTQQCSQCGAIIPKDITVRVHSCPHCGLKIDRDLNASRNILRLGIQSVGKPVALATA